MKINLTSVVTALNGKPVMDEPKVPLTLRGALYFALDNVAQDEQKMSIETKTKAVALMNKLFGGDEVDLTAEEITLLKERVGKIFNPGVMGAINQVLDGTNAATPADNTPATPPTEG